MSTRKCRVCTGELFEVPLLEYKDMPAISQFLPRKEDFGDDSCVDLRICQCTICGLIQLDNEPVYYFREVIRSGSVSPEVRAFRTKQFQDFIDTNGLKGKKIVEIGCGRGEYLSIMSQTGAEAYGLECRQESVDECKEKGLKAVQGFLESLDYQIEHGPFDAFYICNFLEHIDQPSVALRAIANNLVDGGIGIVEVPNTDLLLTDQCFYKFTLEHLLNFTQDSLEFALHLNGFEILSCKPIRHGSPLSAVVRKRQRLDFTGFKAGQGKLEEELKKFVASYDPRQVAFWGAGHYTFGILSAFDFLKEIRYIIDSAPFKQSRYSPKSHVPIVPPEMLAENPVQAVIVSAAGYSNEVAKILRTEFAPEIAIAVIRNNSLEILT